MPRTLEISSGACILSSFFRSAATCTSTTRVGTPDLSFQTHSRICARVSRRPLASAEKPHQAKLERRQSDSAAVVRKRVEIAFQAREPRSSMFPSPACAANFSRRRRNDATRATSSLPETGLTI